MTKLNQRLKSPLSNRRRGRADIIRLTDLSLLKLRKEWQRYFGPAPDTVLVIFCAAYSHGKFRPKPMED